MRAKALFCVRRYGDFPRQHPLIDKTHSAVYVHSRMSKARRPIRALVVDDLHDAAESLARLLQTMGCAATFVTDSSKALDAADAMKAEIVFLDIGMPTLDGYQLARMFRHRHGDGMVLVAVTAYGAARDRVQCRAAGFDAHVQKPADIHIVESILATVLPARW